MVKILFLVAFTASIVTQLESANILGIFYYPSYSHQIVYQRLVKDLANRGHHLTILTADKMDSKHPNISEIYMESSYEGNINFVESRKSGGLKLFYDLLMAHFKRSELQMENPKVKDLIINHKNYHFDVILLEYLFKSHFIYFGELYNCPIIGISAIGVGIPVHELMGNQVNPLIHSEIMFPYQHGRMKFKERVSSFIYYFATKFFLQPIFEYVGWEQAKKMFILKNSSVTVQELEDRVDLVFVNTNPLLDYVRPITPNTIQLGFMHVETPKPIIGELKEYLDSSQNGIIYMSLGSNVKSKDLTPETKTIFLNVFRKLSYDVLWKFEDDRLANKSDNVKISKWLPQTDLLAHPNVKLFITQGGLMSLEESIDREMPMIGIPFLLDQYQNTLKVQEEGFGLSLDLEDVTEASLHNAITEVMKPKYRENIKRFKKLVYDEPMTSREKAVFWTEYVIRNKGAKNLKYPGRLLPFYQKCGLDVIATIILTVYSFSKLLSYLRNSVKSNKKLKIL